MRKPILLKSETIYILQRNIYERMEVDILELMIFVLLCCLSLLTCFFIFRPIGKFKQKIERHFSIYLFYFTILLLLEVVTIGFCSGFAVQIFGEQPTDKIFTYILLVILSFQMLFILMRGYKHCIDAIKSEKFVPMLLYFLALILLAPDFIFGMLYDLWILKEMKLSMFDSLYFSFATHYSLQLSEEPFKTLITLINNSELLRIVQVIHTFVNKITELVVLSIVASRIVFVILGESKSLDKVAKIKKRKVRTSKM
jgi:hypothetical protein